MSGIKQLPGSKLIPVTLTLSEWNKVLYVLGVGTPVLPKENFGGLTWQYSGDQPTQEKIKGIVEEEIIPQINIHFQDNTVEEHE